MCHWYCPTFPVSVREVHEKLARRYGVPLLSLAQIEGFSKERGVTIERGSLYKATGLINAIEEWRKIEQLRCGHRPGSERGEGGATAPPHPGGEDEPA